jgi:GxxExxY protein
MRELSRRRLHARRQVRLPVEYKGLHLECSHRLDVVVEERIVLELKCVDTLLPIHEAQLLTYLRLSGYRVGLVMNFHVPKLKEGIIRKVI